jgi:hypothetical protein
MSEVRLLQELQADLQLAPAAKVIYLEGKTDVPIFFALLGVREPRDGIHRGVLVRGLGDRSGSGGSSVVKRVELAAQVGYSGIFGLTDGDGASLADLAARFDLPFSGPCFAWKGYCIENLLAKTGWPPAWGESPDWAQVLLEHAAYVGLNRVHRMLREKLQTLRLHRFARPSLDVPMQTVSDVVAALRRDKHLVVDLDVEQLFLTEVGAFESAVASSIDEGHAFVDGKSLVNVFAPRRTGQPPEKARSTWTAHATAAGGLVEVRELWRRITGRLP